jgi:hypothetical protein
MKILRWVAMITALALLAGVVGVILYGYLDRPKPDWIDVADKTVWDWLEVLIVPAALAIGVYWLNRRQAKRERDQQRSREAEREATEEAWKNRELEVENQRAQDVALQAYLEQMSKLMIDHGLWSQSMADNVGDAPEGEGQALIRDARAFIQRNKRASARREHKPQLDSVSAVARALTLTVLPRLDSERKRSVVQFLYESSLIDKPNPVISLEGADLRGVNLHRAKLQGADLRNANLESANLTVVNLEGADLLNANLKGTDLRTGRLRGANLWGADLERANLSMAKLTDAKVLGTNFDGADLSGATMPNGQKYEEWLETPEGQKWLNNNKIL